MQTHWVSVSLVEQ